MHLDIAPFCSSKFKASLLVNPNDTGIPYQLYAIIEHRGSLHNGHYIAYVKVKNYIIILLDIYYIISYLFSN